LQVTAQVGGLGQAACPFPDGGAGHALLHVPQWFGSVGAKHEVPAPDAQVSVVEPLHVTLHAPPPSAEIVQTGLPVPASGPAHEYPHVPQLSVVVGSTHPPLQMSGVEPSTSHPKPQAPLVQVA
jgi:hypothetical protein